MKSRFDGLLSFKEATDKWGLNESTLRKAVTYGKLVENVDVRKFGKQWIVTEEAMLREYGNPKSVFVNLLKKEPKQEHSFRYLCRENAVTEYMENDENVNHKKCTIQ